MLSIFKYCFVDLIRNRWAIFYTLFYFAATSALLLFNSDTSKTVVGLLNMVLFITPLVSLLLGIIYYYQNKDFIELLLAQPIKRSQFFFGNYFGLTASLTLSLIIGIGLPTLIFGSKITGNLLHLLLVAILLTLIFSALALLISILNENRLKGFGKAIFWWLMFAIIYDGVFLLLLLFYSDYPLENFALIATFLNPIDLTRIFILLKLDYAALLGFTGASVRMFMGSQMGYILMIFTASIWVIVPLFFINRFGNKKDY